MVGAAARARRLDRGVPWRDARRVAAGRVTGTVARIAAQTAMGARSGREKCPGVSFGCGGSRRESCDSSVARGHEPYSAMPPARTISASPLAHSMIQSPPRRDAQESSIRDDQPQGTATKKGTAIATRDSHKDRPQGPAAGTAINGASGQPRVGPQQPQGTATKQTAADDHGDSHAVAMCGRRDSHRDGSAGTGSRGQP